MAELCLLPTMLGWLDKCLLTSDSFCILIDAPYRAVAYVDLGSAGALLRLEARKDVLRVPYKSTLLWLWSFCKFRAAVGYPYADNDLGEEVEGHFEGGLSKG
jgi:hypothetical protein